MTITVHGPNNITIDFPDGTDPETIDGVMRKATMGPDQKTPYESARANMAAISQNPIKPDNNGTFDAAWQGARHGVTFGFGDELRAGAAAALQPVLGTGQGGDSFGSRYDRNLAQERGALEAARYHHPVASTAGEIGGMIATAPLAELNVVRGAGLGARMANGAIQGAAMGGVYGFGSGEGGAGERLKSAATGAAMGGVGGAAAPALIAGAGAIGRAVATPFRTAFRPEQEASRRVGVALTRDGSSPAQAQTMLQGAQQSGTPLVVADAGGETTRGLARSAANTSPEARTALTDVTDARQNSQIDRTETFIRGLVGRANAHQTTQDLQNAARLANGPAYAKAYSAAPAVWTAELEQLTTAPAVQDAIRKATRTGANSATGAGFTPPVNPFVRTANGGVELRIDPKTGQKAIPSLQFWDHVQRNLSDAYDIAVRKGANSEARDINILRQNLINHLDQKVPEFNAARAGAARFFGAQDALEAGKVAVTTKADNATIQQGVSAMNPAEKQLFQEGFASELINRIREGGNRYDVTNSIFVKSPAARERIDIAIGKQKAAQLEAFMRTENIMSQLKKAVQGNSTTARQIAEYGLAGGIGGSVINGGFDPTSANWWTSALMSGLALRGVKAGNARINQRVAQRVGELLASNDPQALNKAAAQIAVNPKLMNAVRVIESSIGRAAVKVPLPGEGGGVLPVPAGNDQPQ